MDRSGRVILVGTLAPWEEPKEAGDQIWGINRAYLHQPNLDRLYMMDPLAVYKEQWGEGFIDEVNALDVPVIMQRAYSGFTRLNVFNHTESYDNFSIKFFGSTVANAIANAIEEGFAKIVLHKMYVKGKSDEYLYARACIGFWVGQAVGAGIEVVVDPDSFLPQKSIDSIAEGRRLRTSPPPPPPLKEMLRDEVRRWAARRKANPDGYQYPEVTA